MIRIVTDSGCDLPDHILTGHQIEVVPLTLRFGDDTFQDRTEITIDRFWDLLTAREETPQTAAPSVGQFETTFSRLAEAGADGIVVMCMSSAVSATHRSAILAAESFDRVPVRVIDTRLVTGALGLAVMEAAEQALAGADLDSVVATAADACEATSLYATLDTLEYLRKGGRIGGAAAFVGGLLDVKPIISFEVGEVTAAGRVRTRRRALEEVLDHLREINDRVARLGVVHSDAAELDDFVAGVTEIHGTAPLIIRMGPIVGAHAGPGVLGVVYRLQ